MKASHLLQEDVITSTIQRIRACDARRQVSVTGLGWLRTFQRLTANLASDPALDGGNATHLRDGLGAELRLARQNLRNALEGIGYVEAAQGVLDELNQLLARAAELIAQAERNPSRAELDEELRRLLASLDQQGQGAEFNGAKLFVSRAVEVCVEGYPAVDLTIGALEGVFRIGASLDPLTTVEGARKAAACISEATAVLHAAKAVLDTSRQQLMSIFCILGTQVENLAVAHAWVRDARVTEEVVNLVKFELLSQAGMNALSQTQTSSREVLAILQRFQVLPSTSIPGVAT